MTTYDVAMLGVVIAGMVWGAWRGITWQVASIASLVLGYVAAFPLSSQLAARFPGEPVVARVLALLVCYAAVSGGVFLVAWLVRTTLRQWKFEAYDRHLGMLLGGAEGALLGVLATVFLLSLTPSTRPMVLTSPSGRVVGGVLDAVQPALPAEVRSMLAQFWEGQAAAARGQTSAEVVTSIPEPEAAEPLRRTKARAEPEEPAIGDLLRQNRARAEQAVTEAAKAVRAEADQSAEAAARPVEAQVEEAADALGDFLRESRNRVKRSVADAIKQEIDQGASVLAGPEEAASSAEPPKTVRGFLKQTRSRLGQSVAEAVKQEIDRAVESDGRSGDVKRR
ncbi:MAG: CvpA family protein [Isosphaeraceae bacterium]|nr:CvpA family protein [Isosphaeraceae bacterium]